MFYLRRNGRMCVNYQQDATENNTQTWSRRYARYHNRTTLSAVTIAPPPIVQGAFISANHDEKKIYFQSTHHKTIYITYDLGKLLEFRNFTFI